MIRNLKQLVRKIWIYQYLASDYLKYFYLRNNLHLDELSEEELEILVRFSINKDYFYDELYNIGMTDDKWDELHDKQISVLSAILNLFEAESQNALQITHKIIIYNDFSVKKR